MKKLLFAAVTLDIGGIETALVTLLNYLADEKENNNYKYDITLVLEKKQGVFLNTINKRIHIIEYTPNSNKIVFIRKAINAIKQMNFKIKYKNQFDFSASFATYSLPDSFVARNASTNSALWGHMDYLAQFDGNKEEVKKYFEQRHYNEFKNIIFVSNTSKETFLQCVPDAKDKTLFINNLINYKDILEKSEENLQEPIKKESTVFLNVGRHDEKQKKLSRIIEAAKMLVQDGENFKIVLVGDGKDNKKYIDMVKASNMEDKIIFVGKKKNPYSYFKIADCLLLTSDYEGSPVIYTETMVLNKPIISTEVAGCEQIKDKFGYIVNKDSKSVYIAMKEFIHNGYIITEKFDPKKYNEEIIKKLEKII